MTKRAVRLEVTWTATDGLSLTVYDKRTDIERALYNSAPLLFSLPLRRNPWHSTEILCEEIIQAYASASAETDASGQPTSTQLHHWQFHLISPKRDHCRICEGQASPRQADRPRGRPSVGTTGKVEIRRKVATTTTTPSPISRSTKSATELGF